MIFGKNARSAASHLPPGPRIGALATMNVVRRPGPFMAEMRERYGDVFAFRGVAQTMVIVMSPAHARTVFTADADSLDVFASKRIKGIFGDSSVLGTAGSEHRGTRKILTPPFQGQRMRAYGQLTREAALQRTESFRAGDEFRALEVTTAITLDVIIRAVFGVEPTDPNAHAVKEGVKTLLKAVDPLLFFAAALHHPLYPPYRRLRRAIDVFNTIMYPIIEARRSTGKNRDDILSLMVESRYDDGQPIPTETIRSQLFTLLFAGLETTASVLAWALRELVQNPMARERVIAEIDSLGPDPDPDQLFRLPYLSAVCDETMRLHTVGTHVGRTLRQPMQLDAWTLPAGTGVAVGIIAIHEDARIHPDPFTFRPERFLEKKFSPFEFLPFGGGHRRCVAAAFAEFEMRVVLATLLQRFDFALADSLPEKSIRRDMTMGPSRGIPLRIRKRLAA